MILLAFALLQAAPPSDQALMQRCLDSVRADAETGITTANEWLISGGGIDARQCLGLAYSAAERWAPAATAFEQAARDAETARDPRRADLWVKSGNAWLAADDPAKAIAAFDAALASTELSAELRGEVHLDRGRALVAQNNLAAARTEFDSGVKLVPTDPFGWYLSSALALRMDDLARARSDIAEAIRLAPAEAGFWLHAGNVAGRSGELEGARGMYARAARLAPGTDIAKAAEAAIRANAE